MRRDYGRVYNYRAITTAGIGRYRIVRFGPNDMECDLATAATDLLIGITTDIDAALNERCDVVRSGLAPVVYGGTVTRGQLVTSNASGAAVVASPAAGENVRIIGIAEVSGVSGDIGAVFLSPGMLQG